MLARPRTPGEYLGFGLGLAMAPAFALASLARRGRVFHPQGACYSALAQPARDVPERYAALAQALAGGALIRLSAGFWRGTRGFPDVLGAAVRFSGAKPPPLRPQADVQDLLFVTSPSLWRLPVDAFTTNTRDFLANVYHAIAPFELAGERNRYLRLVPATPSGGRGRDRYQRLRRALEQGPVRFRLQVADRADASDWSTLLELRLDQVLKPDQATVRFSPFCTGMGIRPHGFLQFLRPWPYALGQFLRTRWREQHIGAVEGEPGQAPPDLPRTRDFVRSA